MTRDYSLPRYDFLIRPDGQPRHRAVPENQREKRTFDNVTEARLALSVDKLATIYRSAGRVFIIAAAGSGNFSAEEWDS